jgi:hypothetical protein
MLGYKFSECLVSDFCCQGLDTLTGWGSEDLDDMLNDSPTTCLVR